MNIGGGSRWKRGQLELVRRVLGRRRAARRRAGRRCPASAPSASMPCSASTSSTCAVSRHDPSRWICSSIACTRLPKSGDEPASLSGSAEHVLVEVLARAAAPHLERARADAATMSGSSRSSGSSPLTRARSSAGTPAMYGHHAHSSPGSAFGVATRSRITSSAVREPVVDLGHRRRRCRCRPPRRCRARGRRPRPARSAVEPVRRGASSAKRTAGDSTSAAAARARPPNASSRISGAPSASVNPSPRRPDEPQVAGEVGAPRVLVHHPDRPGRTASRTSGSRARRPRAARGSRSPGSRVEAVAAAGPRARCGRAGPPR